jgi:hypothetical protein
VKQVGRELGVRYVLEGSVRKAANRVRITGQLIDAATGAHLWADRFDGGLGDIFDLQDQVTERVVGALAPAVETAEMDRAKHKPTESLDAYTIYLRGLAKFYQYGNQLATTEALRLFNSGSNSIRILRWPTVMPVTATPMPKPTPGFQTQRTRLLKRRGWLSARLNTARMTQACCAAADGRWRLSFVTSALAQAWSIAPLCSIPIWPRRGVAVAG